ncbi:tyrosine-type recombinase/integrase [Streptomyces sp. AC536]|uniref:tyrosine-type recombinase/integrase n=1 Tax=Streptomyces buecherae TaxID=2763006 RepID=UPI00164D495F|nr:tyrosine-type recombinase/integrase [Streptomyces buecherae]MBC3986777.1 tyrosine-type recombinase/integrase [Streptomyces buecherae]QNJ38972.1 tyrosine-type recombinase/integrase [Streptomyces buecherae]
MSVEVMDEEWLLSEEQVRALLGWVRGQAGAHRSVYPFMRMVAEQALRPSEARALRVSDVMFLERDLGKLAARNNGMAREIPLQPQVSVFLREWISESGLHDADLLFPGMRGGPVSASVCQQMWRQAQEVVLPRDALYSWRLGEPISILRDSCLVKWLRMGTSAVTVAEWAGVTPSWLALRYPHCFRTEKVEIDWGHLAEAMALSDALKS